ncbi:energy transducer TonB [Dyella dinghuensis]|uniref:Energy transducer TonB n=1 Tax=Dyella dinghuensis TaxID=1920169 RepID=A0A3S0S3T2_9GAMM|nr:energy transducer TonB [Dyella dinghuensis]RUL64196.1 energy transducer TonB [Dyella dinghuensis]
MPSASLAVVRRAQPDMVRVAALSVAITLNLAALLLVMRPLAPQIADAIQTAKVETVRIIEPPPPNPPQPPDIIVKPLPRPLPVTPPVHVAHVEVAPPVVTPTTEPSDNAKPVTVPTNNNVAPPPSIAPGVVSLAYRSSPLKFPVQALRQRMSGTVLLRVLVDESGKPVDVVVEQSSGFKLLDNSAREQVLSSWLFQPAVIDGHTVRAWARVPVSFAFQQM